MSDPVILQKVSTPVVFPLAGPQGPPGTTDAGALTGTLPILHGGTGATTASGARGGLDVPGLADNNTYTGENNFPAITVGGQRATSIIPDPTGQAGAFLTTNGAYDPSDVSASLSWTTLTIPAAGNPTGTIGLSAVNGTATTFLRSDGAPALSQSITPTWTGLHTFNGGVAGNGSGWTSLTAANLTGTVADARLSANVPLLSAQNAFAANNTFGNGFSGNGQLGVGAGQARFTTAGIVVWTNSSSNAFGTADTGFSRNAAGIVGITNGSTGNGALTLGQPTISTVGLTVNRIASGTANYWQCVDSDGTTVRAKIDSGGALTCANITNTGFATATTVVNCPLYRGDSNAFATLAMLPWPGNSTTGVTANTFVAGTGGLPMKSSSGTDVGLSITSVYNQTSTAAGTDLLISRTQTAVGSGNQRLVDCQVGGVSLARVDNAGTFVTKANAAPADATLSAGEMAIWFDSTNGASALKIKAKQADGTVKTGSISLA